MTQVVSTIAGIQDRLAFGLSLLPGLGITVVVVFVVALIARKWGWL